jgi:hypothetical protein
MHKKPLKLGSGRCDEQFINFPNRTRWRHGTFHPPTAEMERGALEDRRVSIPSFRIL